MSQAIWKVMLRPQGDRNYHYAATKHSRKAPKRGETIGVRDIDDRRVKAVIEHVRRELNARYLRTRIFTVQADEIEA